MVCVVAVAAAVAYYTSRQTPVFEASTTLRIRTREPNLPDIYRTISTGVAGGELATEIAVLGSRALKEDAAGLLGLQLAVVEPARVARGDLVRGVSVSPAAAAGEYQLLRRPDGRFTVFVADSARRISLSGTDGRVHVPGVTFVLTPVAARYGELRVSVSSLPDAVDRLQAVAVSQLSREANILTLSYSDTDSLIAAQIPNLIAAQYLARRQAIEKAEAGSAARFLREQLHRVSSELARAEDRFRGFRERERLLDPAVETSSEVARLIAKESERAGLEAERRALTQSLAEIESAGSGSGSLSTSRRLSALPILLRNEATSTLLSALMTAESEKAAMISATATDPDMLVLTAKIEALEDQLRAVTRTHLQNLGNQVSSLDSTLGMFGRELSAIPRRHLEYARLERNVTSLESVYNLLQTRLNEAEIAEAVTDASVQVVDSALIPSAPSSPRPLVNLAAGVAVGLMLGVGLACIREYRDGSVHSRRDVVVATGVPVIGLIPRIPKARGRIALITGRRKIKHARSPMALAVANGRHENERIFTFLSAGAPPPDPVPPVAEPLRREPMATGLELTASRWTNIVAEAYSLLLTNVAFARTSPPVKIVAITSPLAEEGKTTCAVNLSITLALRGSKVLLVDADLRRGVVHTTLGADRVPGLSEVLSRSLPELEAIHSIKVGDHGGMLHFLTTGAIPSNPSALLESPGFSTLLGRLKEEYDTIILDCPPVNIISDASVLGLNADTVLIVARSGVTGSAALSDAVDQLTRVGVPLLGVVLNDIDFKRDAVYDSSYRSYNASYEVSASEQTQ